MVGEIKELSKNVFEILRSISPDNSWVSQGMLIDAVEKVQTNFDKCACQATKALDDIFSSSCDVVQSTTKTSQLIKSWHDGDQEFCALSIISYLIGYFDFDPEQHKELILLMFISSVLAEVDNDLPYHNNLHFRKVLLHAARMADTHNKLFKNSIGTLSHQDIAKLIVSACIHDLGHDGSSNIVDRKYIMARIEKLSFGYALPFLEKSQVSTEILDDICIMLIGTDTAPFGDPISPSNQIKVAYEYHYGIQGQGGLHLSKELSVLEDNDRLSLLCVMLHEADIMNSAGVDYDITCYESVSVSKEFGESGAYPEDTLLFLDKICNGGFCSDAGSFLADDNLALIKDKIMKDFKSGNSSYV